MKRPPLLMHLRIHGEEKGFGLWLPLFLLLPLALVVLIVLSPLILIAILALWPSGWGKRALLVLWTSFGMVCALRGLTVDVRSGRQTVYVSVI
ncbi:MAG: hypothetical protein ABID87_07825 [Chloroflexota bacterium]